MILDAAAALLAERGESVSMADIAEAAGVGRATVYRYFPSRDALLDALCQTGTAELSRLLSGADLDRIAVPEGIARVARAFVGLGSKYAALMPNGPLGQQVAERNDVDLRQLTEPVHALLRRGTAEGVLRDDLAAETLWSMLAGLLDVAGERVTADHVGVEQASAEAVSIFLYGATRNTPQAHRG
jgi:AcrR family transcriptional regulator